ncbi:glycosyltransferase involved in cell wall biosynthesis [Mucilaginibacter yixingensis]|uniref:Glycosyltransferase involved in cell wall biosynthesis n=1 Tax=Mucilaginibacter yixingensis TaxID=1295612 RepID=A0A2T5JFS4_9SPHI|nr:glycosyltransferase family 2 protein [Mucilaginibacter yixingensis]PTR01283.1 glycosyltransferase involved in cell wall biosynthesis [Mucilaginibacter yixingensis]
MESSPLISVIIPVFNAKAVIKNCLQSIISQTYKSFDVWFIDGASNDGTLDIIQAYIKEYDYIHLVSEPDHGIYDAMNKGIALSKGNWRYFLGSDDTFFNDHALANIALNIESTNAEVVYGNVIMRGKNQWNLDNVVFDGLYTLEKLIDRNICHQAIFYKDTVFQKNGNFDLTYPTSADFDFNMRCYANATFEYADVIVANFFVGGQSTQHNDERFHQHRGALMMKYFGRRIFTRPFINSRLYLQRAALSKNSPLNLWQRMYCLLACVKLKIQSLR